MLPRPLAFKSGPDLSHELKVHIPQSWKPLSPMYQNRLARAILGVSLSAHGYSSLPIVAVLDQERENGFLFSLS
jgi:hypothetical protein